MKLHLKILLIFFCITSLSFAMERGIMQRRAPKPLVMQIDATEKCILCFDPLIVRKGALVTTYCGHSYHKMCYDRMLKNNAKEKCYCQNSLQSYDPAVLEEIKANKKIKDAQIGCIEKYVNCCAHIQIKCFLELYDIMTFIHKENSSAWMFPG